EHAALDHLAFLHAGDPQQPLGAYRIAEDPHQVVFHRQVEAARAGGPPAGRATAQLGVDAARLVALGADDVQPARGDYPVVTRLPLEAQLRTRRLIELTRGGELRLEVAPEHDVGAAARHVGGDRDRAGAASLRDDVR